MVTTVVGVGGIKSIQRHIETIIDPTISVDITLDPVVDPDSAYCVFGGFQSTSNVAETAAVRLKLLSGSQVNLSRTSAGGQNSEVSFEVIEFYSDVNLGHGIKSIQRGDRTGAGTVEINEVDINKTIVNNLGYEGSSTDWHSTNAYVTLTNGSTVTVNIQGTTNDDGDVSFNVVEFY